MLDNELDDGAHAGPAERTPSSTPLTTYALQRDPRRAAPGNFPEQLAELLAHYEGGPPPDHPFARLGRGLPGGDERP